MRKFLPLILIVALASNAGCAWTIKTGVSPVADVANAGGKIEETAHVILTTAVSSQKAGVIPETAVDLVAIAVNRIGHLGLDLNAALGQYNKIKAAGGDVTAQRSLVSQTMALLTQTLADVGKAIPEGTVKTIDDAVSAILSIILSVDEAVRL